MRYFYSSTFADFKTAQKVYIRSSNRRRFWFHFQMWGIISIGALLLLIFVAFHLSGTTGGLFLAPIIGGAVAGGVVAPLLRPWQIRRVYKAWNGDILEVKQLYLEIEDSMLVSGIEGKSEGRFRRAAVCDFVETDEMALLFLGKKKFLYIARTALPVEGWQKLKEWLALPGAPTGC